MSLYDAEIIVKLHVRNICDYGFIEDLVIDCGMTEDEAFSSICEDVLKSNDIHELCDTHEIEFISTKKVKKSDQSTN